MKKEDAFREFLHRAPHAPSMEAMLRAKSQQETGGFPVMDHEYSNLLLAQALETGMRAQLFLKALGYDSDSPGEEMGVVRGHYRLPEIYQKVIIARQPLAKDEKEAKEMAEKFFTETNRHARLFATELAERNR